jgi:hypothetical protein
LRSRAVNEEPLPPRITLALPWRSHLNYSIRVEQTAYVVKTEAYNVRICREQDRGS